MSDGLDIYLLNKQEERHERHISMLYSFASVTLAALLQDPAFEILEPAWDYKDTVVGAEKIPELRAEVELLLSRLSHFDQEVEEELRELANLCGEAEEAGVGLYFSGP
jgi:hypothetical protein